MARLGSLAILFLGVGIWPLVAGLDIPHVHAGSHRPLAHHHLHAGHHRHDAGHHHGPTAPERREEGDREEPRETVLSFQAGAPMLPEAIAVGTGYRAVPEPLPTARHAPRPAEIRSSSSPRAPPG